jgi:hypothetical protein
MTRVETIACTCWACTVPLSYTPSTSVFCFWTFFFGGTRVWTQGLALEPCPSPVFDLYINGIVGFL